MTKVAYFTNAVEQEYFKEYLKDWKVSPNLSNQNFHNKLIKALMLNFKVKVLSIRPINSNFKEKSLYAMIHSTNGVQWCYPKVSTNRIAKLLFLNRRIYNVFAIDSDEEVIFVDTLNLSLLKAAKKATRKHHNKIIGVCTDNPNNISFVKESYNKKLLALANEFDKYVVLTEKGREVASTMYERHEYIAKILMKLGVDEKTAYEDSCLIEHDISKETFDAIKKSTEHMFK